MNRSGRLVHGSYGTPEYRAWDSMWQRCTNPKKHNYGDYGGRGIVPDPKYHDFAVWLAEVGPRPSPDHSIERVDNSLGYVAGNMRWATRKDQQRNRRVNRLITHNGETMCLAAWAELVGICPHVIRRRLSVGWDFGRALEAPVLSPGIHHGEQ